MVLIISLVLILFDSMTVSLLLSKRSDHPKLPLDAEADIANLCASAPYL